MHKEDRIKNYNPYTTESAKLEKKLYDTLLELTSFSFHDALIGKSAFEEYIKYVVVIPSEIVKEAKMKEGDTIKFSVKKGEISLINFGK